MVAKRSDGVLKVLAKPEGLRDVMSRNVLAGPPCSSSQLRSSQVPPVGVSTYCLHEKASFGRALLSA